MANKHGQLAVKPSLHLLNFIELEAKERGVAKNTVMNELLEAGFDYVNRQKMASAPALDD